MRRYFRKSGSGVGLEFLFQSGAYRAMDMRLFEKSPHMAPLLVRLYDSQKLYALVKDKDPLARAELTSAVTALLESNEELTPREYELLTDVLVGLMRQAGHDLRQALAERLSVMDNAPLRLILSLANDDIQISAPVLRNSRVLSDLDLIYIIKSQGSDYWQAIAARENLSETLINLLADTRDKPTAIVLSRNERIHLTAHAINILTEAARVSDEIARPLLMRTELPESVARALYKHVGEDLKEYIRSYFGVYSGDIAAAVDDIILEFSQDEEGDSAPEPEVHKKHARPLVKEEGPEFMPSADMIMAANQFADKGRLTLDVMLKVLKRGQIASFIALFSRYTGLSTQTIYEYLSQPCGKGLAITCRAHGIQKNDFSSIYLLTNRVRSQGRIIDHADMVEVMNYYMRLRPEVARRIVGRKIVC